MHRLEEQFGDRVDFFHLDIDNSDYDVARQEYGLGRRHMYLLVDPNGQQLHAWVGPLNEAVVVQQMESLLAGLNP